VPTLDDFEDGPTDADFDFTTEQEERAAGLPSAQAADYQDPGLTEAILADARTALKLLGTDDEPQGSGAVVAVHWGDYRRQEIWVASGANIGNWYCLGGEFRVGGPPAVDDPRPYHEKTFSREYWVQPPGTVPVQPTWEDVVKRGPVVLLTPGQDGVYAAGWEAGRRRMLEQIETLRDDEDVPPGTGWRAGELPG
jgi:hypothetical protein